MRGDPAVGSTGREADVFRFWTRWTHGVQILDAFEVVVTKNPSKSSAWGLACRLLTVGMILTGSAHAAPLLASLPVVLAAPVSAPAPSEPALQYPEQANGVSALTLEVGVAGWITERSPFDAFAPLVLGLGFSHTIGPARLAWRATLITGPADTAPRFLWADLLSVERVYPGGLEPWWRVGLGFGLDLEGARRSLGSAGYFNADNGAAAGLGLVVGAGFDAPITEGFFLRAEGSVRVHGAAGRTGVLWLTSVGPGLRF